MVLRRLAEPRSQPRFWFIYKSGVLRSHSLFKGLLILNFIRRAEPGGGSLSAPSLTEAAFVRHEAGFVKRQTRADYVVLRGRSQSLAQLGWLYMLSSKTKLFTNY